MLASSPHRTDAASQRVGAILRVLGGSIPTRKSKPKKSPCCYCDLAFVPSGWSSPEKCISGGQICCHMNSLPGNKEYIPPTPSPCVAWNASCLSARSPLQWLRKDTERHWVRKDMQNQEGSCIRGEVWRQEWDPMAKDLGPFAMGAPIRLSAADSTGNPDLKEHML